MKLAASSWLSTQIPLEKIIPIIAGCNFDGIEIAATRSNLANRSELATLLEDTQLDLVAFSAGVPFFLEPSKLNLHSHDESIRNASIEYLFQCIDFASKLGANMIYACSISGDPLDSEAKELFSDSLSDCADYAEKQGIQLAIEPFPTGIVRTIKDALQLIIRTSSRNLGVVFDIGHEVICGGPVRTPFDKYSGLLYDVHFDNNDGLTDRHWSPLTGVIKREEYVQTILELEKSGYDRYVSIELANVQDPKETLRIARDFVLSCAPNSFV